ncbi:hypothetical protein CEUSTIGMA_g8134.t1 [Chlamydomonas eustigma]|uniref:Uncharacterized protein n=1 Tax=Chlamydomonas eustigma TaxID=1157962 RepID=A0A250XCT2_9CHLO|nr:hypothetical protein CEUSTIGMA_g8134.t1 [Chlamydomonas eustigma]|eukprot:GAX80699.1 hypothetical protein CEUSTIGMA_g8134.t1 [Chlamydomonas eustigma]
MLIRHRRACYAISQSAASCRVSIVTRALPGLVDVAIISSSMNLSILSIASCIVGDYKNSIIQKGAVMGRRTEGEKATLSQLTRSIKQQNDDEEEEGLTWAVTAVISCIPIFNSIAWLLPALSSSVFSYSHSPSSPPVNKYYLYFMLYSIPLLRSGVEFDAYSLLMLALCVGHVQVERLARTEHGYLTLLIEDKGPAFILESALVLLRAFKSLLGDAVTEVSGLKEVERTKHGLLKEGQNDRVEDVEALELKMFDRKLMAREREDLKKDEL